MDDDDPQFGKHKIKTKFTEGSVSILVPFYIKQSFRIFPVTMSGRKYSYGEEVGYDEWNSSPILGTIWKH